MSDITRYAVAAHGQGEHARTTTSGAVLSVSVDLSTTPPVGLDLDPLASDLQFRKEMFISRLGATHDEFPTIFASQFPVGGLCV